MKIKEITDTHTHTRKKNSCRFNYIRNS